MAQSETPSDTPPPINKTKRQRAEENWKVLDNIITESEQFEKGSVERSKVLEKLHQVLRNISKKPRLSNRTDFTSATEEWDDFLAPTCETCNQFVDGGCQCEELAEHANSFLAPGGVDEEVEDTFSNGAASSSASGKAVTPAASATAAH